MAAFFSLSTYLIRQAGSYMFEAKVREEMRICQEFAHAVDPDFAARDADALYASVCALSEESDSRALVLDAYGVVQADPLSLLNGVRLERAEVVSALEKGESAYGYYGLSETGGAFRSFWRMITGAQTHDALLLYVCPMPGGGALALMSQADELYDSLFHFQARAALMALVVCAAVCALSLFVMRLFTRPITELSEGIARISRGDLQTEVEVRGRSEFADLATAFNTMCRQLDSLDRSRNQFVSNASHELKTPLSTMKILIETLLYQEVYDPDMSREFLTDIDKEIDRLSVIVSDLLTLVHMDSAKGDVKKTPVKLSEVLSETVTRLLPLAREHGIEMNCTIREQITVQGDAVKLAQVFYNLIDNALKYTPRSGLVRVELQRSGKRAICRVSDDGVGIPAEDLPRVFDRFYRVDKTRSRETGGTGLGLAIAQQIAQMHGGSITATSEEGKGSTFTVEIPISGVGA